MTLTHPDLRRTTAPGAERPGLRAGDLSLELAPASGGSIASFRLDDIDLLRPMPADATDAIAAGMFPMAPFANCIRDNAFTFMGKAYRINPNMEGSALNFHGSAWQLPWAVDKHDTSRATLRLAGARVDGVYRFDGEQTFDLSTDGLAVTLRVTNRSGETMPFCFGLHPWFPRHGNALLRFAADGLWTEGQDGVAGELIAVPPNGDYSTFRAPPRDGQNNCYTGWMGGAAVAWPELGVGLSISADPVFSHLMFHVPANDAEAFCVEPQSNAPCAFDGLDRAEVRPGVYPLEPGETITGTVRFTPVRRADFIKWRLGLKDYAAIREAD